MQVSDMNISLSYFRDVVTPDPILSRGNQIQIAFLANRADYGKGFFAFYQAGILENEQNNFLRYTTVFQLQSFGY